MRCIFLVFSFIPPHISVYEILVVVIIPTSACLSVLCLFDGKLHVICYVLQEDKITVMPILP